MLIFLPISLFNLWGWGWSQLQQLCGLAADPALMLLYIMSLEWTSSPFIPVLSLLWSSLLLVTLFLTEHLSCWWLEPKFLFWTNPSFSVAGCLIIFTLVHLKSLFHYNSKTIKINAIMEWKTASRASTLPQSEKHYIRPYPLCLLQTLFLVSWKWLQLDFMFKNV